MCKCAPQSTCNAILPNAANVLPTWGHAWIDCTNLRRWSRQHWISSICIACLPPPRHSNKNGVTGCTPQKESTEQTNEGKHLTTQTSGSDIVESLHKHSRCQGSMLPKGCLLEWTIALDTAQDLFSKRRRHPQRCSSDSFRCLTFLSMLHDSSDIL